MTKTEYAKALKVLKTRSYKQADTTISSTFPTEQLNINT